jgi:predicted nucleic acid-binding protein
VLVLVDTNVLLRVVEPAHAHHVTAVEAIESLDSLGHELVIVPQIGYEFWAVATRPINVDGLGLSTSETRSKLDSLLSMFRLLRDERTIYERWQRMVAQYDVKGKQVYDARIVAALQRHHISHLLTFNAADFRRYSEINILEPHRTGTLGPAN